MNEEQILQQVANGTLSVQNALLKLKTQPFADIGYAKVDLHRKLRKGHAEVIYGESKTADQILGIARAMVQNGQENVLITRISEDKAKILEAEFALTYEPTGRIALIGKRPAPDGIGTVLVATGGTSDLPVAEEAAFTAEAFGNEVQRIYDVGIAGLHRLLAHVDDIMRASVIVAIAGMDGALPSAIAGLAHCPVVAVPTSVGYGAAFHGVAPLLTMLNSCASGVGVVNIDNGFGGAYLASMINHTEAPN